MAKLTYTKSAQNIIFKALGFEERKGYLYYTKGDLANLMVMYGTQPVKVKDIQGFHNNSLLIKISL